MISAPMMPAFAIYRDLKEKTALITGGASGIGAAMVRAFHEQGASVCFCDIDSDRGWYHS